MKKSVFAFFVFVALGAPAVALGGEPPDSGGSFGEQKVARSQEKMIDAKGRKISVVNFDDAVIEGKARGPDGFVLRSREAASGRSVLELRRDFRKETLADAFGGMPVVPNLP
jgi:hypothetical protein